MFYYFIVFQINFIFTDKFRIFDKS